MDVNSLAPLAAIDALLTEKRKVRESLNADIAALERAKELLAGVLLPSSPPEVMLIAMNPGGAMSDAPTSPPMTLAPGAWHEAALAVFNDGRTHTTAEVYEAAKAVVGPDLGYSAVASWLNRMAGERGILQKDGRGEFSRPAPSRVKVEKSPEEGGAAA